MEMEPEPETEGIGGGGGGSQSPVAHPAAMDVDEAAIATTKRARKRSRYLSPPYTDTTDAHAQEKNPAAAGEEAAPPPPHVVSAAEVLSALTAAALGQGGGIDAAALRFLNKNRNRNRNRSSIFFVDAHPDPHAAAAAAAGGGGGSQDDDGGGNKTPSVSAAGFGLGRKMLSFNAGPDHGSLALTKKKNHPHPPPAGAFGSAAAAAGVNGRTQQNDANAAVSEHAVATHGHGHGHGTHGHASQSAAFAATAATRGLEKKKKKKTTNKNLGHSYVVGNPVALVLDFAEGTPLPSREGLLTTFSRFGSVIDSETTIIPHKHAARVAFATRAQAEAALTSALGGGGAFGAPFAVPPSLQDLPPVRHLPKLPLTDIRSNLGKMILSLSSKPPQEQGGNAKTATAVDSLSLVGEMKCLLAKVDEELQVQRASGAARHA